LFRKKPVEAFITETRPDAESGELERSIGLFQLTMFGAGATIGELSPKWSRENTTSRNALLNALRTWMVAYSLRHAERKVPYGSSRARTS
jgi:hypothetical protein